MSNLVPCPNCRRHVRKLESDCPFCATALDLAELPAPLLPRGRLSRAATFAFGATLAGATSLAACGGESEEGKGKGGESSGGSNASGSSSGGKAGSAGSAGAQNVAGGGIQPVYGAPAAGNTGFGGSGTVPPYGAPPSEGGAGVPVYGAPPPPKP